MALVFVKNKKGTSERKIPSPAKSWLDFWVKAIDYDSGSPVCRHPHCNWLA